MNDSKQATQTVDLAAWLTQIWDEQEKDAINPVKGEIHSRDCESIREHTPFPCECGVPEQILARLAADRKILAECQRMLAMDDWEYSDVPDLAEFVMRRQAEPYSDRPGFQEAWRV